MDNEFASLVDPVVQYVIDTQQRLAGPRADHPGIDEVHDELVHRIEKSRQKADGIERQRDYTDLAERALVYLADEILINSGWEHAETWRKTRLLEKFFYGETVAGDEFFTLARQARGQSRDALETFFLCIALGFQGRYAQGGTGPPRLSARGPIDPDLQRVGVEAYGLVRPRLERFLPEDETSAGGSVPLPGQTRLLRVSILTAITVLATLGGWILNQHFLG